MPPCSRQLYSREFRAKTADMSEIPQMQAGLLAAKVPHPFVPSLPLSDADLKAVRDAGTPMAALRSYDGCAAPARTPRAGFPVLR